MKLRDLPLLSLGGDGGGVEVASASSRSSSSFSSDYSRASGASGETEGTSPLVSLLSPESPTAIEGALKRQGSGKLLKRKVSVGVGGATSSAHAQGEAPRKVSKPPALGSAPYSLLPILCFGALYPHPLLPLPPPLPSVPLPLRQPLRVGTPQVTEPIAPPIRNPPPNHHPSLPSRRRRIVLILVWG
jgi:hypothetical protein